MNRKPDLDDIKYPKRGLKKAEKESLKHAYKSGIDTSISNKHFFHFTERFVEENAKVLEEAREEMERIKRKKKAIYLNRLRHWGHIPPRKPSK